MQRNLGARLAGPVALTAAASLALAAGATAQTAPRLPGQGTPAPTAAPSTEPAPEAPDSPRASVRAFLDLAERKGDFKKAARYLQVPPDEEANGPELARRLTAVLERRLNVKLDAASPLPEGNTQDGLPAGVDTVGNVPDGRGGEDPVYVVRSRDGAGTYWAFSRQTVSRVDGWYDALPDRWVRDWMPQRLQRPGPAGLLWWQWLALPALLAVALALGRILGASTRALLHRLFRRTAVEWDERLLTRTSPALTLLWGAAAAAALLPWLALLPQAHRFVRAVIGGAATVVVFWALWRAIDVWAQFLAERPWAADNPSARSLISVTRNLAKAFVAVGGVVATLGAFGYPVATVLAGLGIGGIALAFGAQKTVENLFGSISLAADQPFRVGDFVRIEDFTGNVERIGMRSTQVRTPDRTLVSIPNGKLADMRIEDFASRDRIRFAATVSLVPGTSEAQVRKVVAGIEAMLRRSPKVWPDAVFATLAALSPASLDVEVLCWFETRDFDEFRLLRQEALLGIMRIIEEAETSVAPTHTVHVAEPKGGGRPG
ncbi:MAG TPA: mechanosensitive ion channel domain-containing protein [Vicinamibacteria bacterium]|nr:mechanosensitive ion channel domain-containing protein [Vicinamibacteria bacterium]